MTVALDTRQALSIIARVSDRQADFKVGDYVAVAQTNLLGSSIGKVLETGFVRWALVEGLGSGYYADVHLAVGLPESSTEGLAKIRFDFDQLIKLTEEKDAACIAAWKMLYE